jgi:hypothetical protein
MTGKRTAAALLWFLTGWMVGAMSAYVLGLPNLLAPVLATAAAILVAMDPAGLLWSRRPQETIKLGGQLDPTVQ